ncbi:uncharacterized protein [Coffea arabica]|uniref:RNA-directed DNA polymerase n=1 Tax=Coffea arabica TaxID=13443 RepID=A0ABM4UEK2_COFAR
MSAGYNPQATCAYHSGAPGHSTANCRLLKHKVQDMLEAGDIVIRKREEQGPNVSKNPLPEHADTVGVIMDDEEFKELVRSMSNETEVFVIMDQPFVIEEASYEEDKRSFILDLTPSKSAALEPVVIEFPEQVPVLSLRQVPWNYSEPVLQMGGKQVLNEEVSVVTRDALLEVLTKAQIPKDISVDNFSYIVRNVLTAKQITFSDEELPAEGTGQNKALYVAVRCNGKMLPKVLIDNGSALNICPWSTLVKLGLQDVKLKPSETIVRGFDGAQRESKGEVNLVVEMGPAQFQIACQVMHFPSVYNVLLGRPWIHSSDVVPSSLHQVLKFVVNDQLITIFTEEDCIILADSEPEEDGNRNASVSSYHTADIVSVSWITSEDSKDEMVLPAASVMMAKEMIRGGYEFDKGLGRNLQGIRMPVELIEKKDQFGLGFRPTAKDIQEMKARKRAEKEGKLGALDIPPLRYTFPKPAEIITSEFSPIDEVETSLTHLFVGAISENGPSDDAEFPDIPQGAIHNWTTKYFPILMAEEDREKTAFITHWGTFCYRVMPFGLKNAGATYQRTMTTLFHDMIHKEMEVYVDDIIIKSKKAEDHLMDLRKLFERLRKYNLKLNPAKCAFGAPAGKLLGFIVSKKGIEIDPTKIKTIRDMPVSKTQKDPPVLVPPKPGRPLIMYLSVLDGAVGCVLGQHDDSGRKEQAIYYLSKKFTQYEANYSFIEKSCCALAWAAQKLRHYLLSHTTYLISHSDPLKYFLEKSMPTGRLAKWQMILSEFDIVFTSQKAVKGQAIADHLAENPKDEDYQPLHTYFPDEKVLLVDAVEDMCEQCPEWRLFFDGTANSFGVGIGAFLVSPERKHYPGATKLQFACTNNMAEYEACIFGLKMALEMEVKELIAFSDSDLLVH